jgi:DNA polymerase-3 subunit beta
MKFIVERDTLKTALNRALKGVEMNSTLSILTGILITAAEGKLVLENTNMDVSLRQSVIANVEEPGQTVMPTKLLNDIVSHLKEPTVLFESDGNTVDITCGNSYFNVNTFSPKDYPSFPQYSIDSTVELPAALLNEMVNKVVVAASTDKNRAILNGILLSVKPNQLRLVTTDSVRLAVAEAKVVSEVEDFQIIVPSRNLRNALSLASEEKTLTIACNQSQIIFLFGDLTYISRRIEGTYPNYQKLIPTSHASGIRLRINDLYESMQRVRTMTVSNSEITFQIAVEQSLLVITSKIPDQGRAREEIPVEAEGEDLSISFNSRFIYDCLQKAGDDDMITFEAESPFKPGIFKTTGEVNFLYLVMPVRPNY